MDPTVWGPLMWDVAFEVARHADAEPAFKLFKAMSSFLPCSYCRESYRKYMDMLRGHSGLSAVEWLWTIRDMVHQKHNKPTLSLEQLEKRAQVSAHPVAPVAVFDLLILLFGAAGGDAAPEEALAELIQAVPWLRLAIHPPALREHLPDPPAEAEHTADAWLQRVVNGRNKVLIALGGTESTLQDALQAIEAARNPITLHEVRRARNATTAAHRPGTLLPTPVRRRIRR